MSYKLRFHELAPIYRVNVDVVFVTVIAVGKRDKDHIYAAARKRLG